MLVEVCSTSIQSIKNAALAGADRIELCTALELGGLTPSKGLLERAQELNLLDIHCLVRPRGGHFMYTDEEINVIEGDIAYLKELGCKGLVLGALTEDYDIHFKLLERWKQSAGTMYLTFHRAFDVVKYPTEALQQLIDLGFDCVLTAGQSEKAIDGFKNLCEWQYQFGDQILIMPGSGVNATNCLKFKTAGFKALHLSGAAPLPNLTPPNSIHSEISFLGQPIFESNQANIHEVVNQVKD